MNLAVSLDRDLYYFLLWSSLSLAQQPACTSTEIIYIRINRAHLSFCVISLVFLFLTSSPSYLSILSQWLRQCPCVSLPACKQSEKHSLHKWSCLDLFWLFIGPFSLFSHHSQWKLTDSQQTSHGTNGLLILVELHLNIHIPTSTMTFTTCLNNKCITVHWFAQPHSLSHKHTDHKPDHGKLHLSTPSASKTQLFEAHSQFVRSLCSKDSEANNNNSCCHITIFNWESTEIVQGNGGL